MNTVENHKHTRNKLRFLLKIMPVAPLDLPTRWVSFVFGFLPDSRNAAREAQG